MIKKFIIKNGKKYVVNAPDYRDAGFLDSAGSGSVLPTPQVFPPFIGLNPKPVTTSVGSIAVFSASVGPYGPPQFNMQFQWLVDGVPLVEGGQITGSNTRYLTITSASVGNDGYYSLFGQSQWGSATTLSASLTVV